MKGLVLISDEVNEVKITMYQWENRNQDESNSYPYVKLTNGQRFYFNRFLFL